MTKGLCENHLNLPPARDADEQSCFSISTSSKASFSGRRPPLANLRHSPSTFLLSSVSFKNTFRAPLGREKAPLVFPLGKEQSQLSRSHGGLQVEMLKQPTGPPADRPKGTVHPLVLSAVTVDGLSHDITRGWFLPAVPCGIFETR